jgi:hypothetical protein
MQSTLADKILSRASCDLRCALPDGIQYTLQLLRTRLQLDEGLDEGGARVFSSAFQALPLRLKVSLQAPQLLQFFYDQFFFVARHVPCQARLLPNAGSECPFPSLAFHGTGQKLFSRCGTVRS